MHFPEQPNEGLMDAISAIRRYLEQYVPPGADRDDAEDRFRSIERAALVGLALELAGPCNVSDAVFLAEPVDGDFRWLYTNGAFARLHGVGADSLADELLSSRPDTVKFAEQCRLAMTSLIPQDFDDNIDRPDCPDCPIELHTRITPVIHSTGACYRIVGVSRDITGERLAERQLRRQNRRLQNILSSINEGFVVVDRDRNISFVNPRTEQILGIPRTQLVGSALADVLPDLHADRPRETTEFEFCADRYANSQPILTALGQWISARAFPSQDGVAIYLQDITERKYAELGLEQGLVRIQASLDGVVNAMAFAVEMRDPYTGGHQRRVSALACAIARRLGYSAPQLETIRIAGLLHDIGKISIPTEILNRPGRLSEPERAIVRTHAQVGYEILKEIEFDAPVALIALQHHERLDGSGYPQGLFASAIIPEARILAIADVVEAMASHRPYRAALGVEAALKEIIAHRGVLYDDLAVGACLTAFTESGFDFDQMMQTELARRGGGKEPSTGRQSE